MTRPGEAKSLPSLLAIGIGFACGFAGDRLFGFSWWLRVLITVIVSLLVEGANQVVRRRFRKGLGGRVDSALLAE
ncbi:hypothetical protein [Streptomyces sp. NPDC089919]|uniref:hypothetical protein n=1 Tax=Streptomyces sp. NPDC089919 TaxID=3155188 RepID=UPI003442A7B2